MTGEVVAVRHRKFAAQSLPRVPHLRATQMNARTIRQQLRYREEGGRERVGDTMNE
jgi:hypothetical protein